MKTFRIIVLIYIYIFIHIRVEASDGDWVRVGGYGFYASDSNHYYLTLGQIATAPRWDPALSDLPINVSKYLIDARNYVMAEYHLQQPPSIVDDIVISRLHWYNSNTNIIDAPDLTNKWALHINMQWVPEHRSCSIIGLMDATYAIAIDLSQLKSNEMTNELRKRISKYSPVILSYFDEDTNAEKSIDGATVNIPDVRWKPDANIPYSKWLMAMFILCSSKKSISAHQIHRMLKVTYKTAWFLCHRIRYAMAIPAGSPKLSGTVEADETYIGGKGQYKGKYLRQTPVVALVERGGDVRTAVVVNVTQHNIGKILHENVDKAAILNTDEHASYKTPGTEFKRHDTVVHSAYEFSRPQSDGTKAGINSAESFFSLLKRGVYGSWHHVSREHLNRYVSEFEFRWNHRKVSDGQRTREAVAATDGKRLTYRQAI